MTDQMKIVITALVLTLVSAQGYAAGYMKFEGVKGESRAAHDSKHDKWINLDSAGWAKEQAGVREHERRVERIDTRMEEPRHEMHWDNVRNEKSADDRPTEEVSFYFNKIKHEQPGKERRIAAPKPEQPAGLLLPAVQKIR